MPLAHAAQKPHFYSGRKWLILCALNFLFWIPTKSCFFGRSPPPAVLRMLDQGVDIVTVKELLGHSTVLVTMRYLHPNLESKAQAVAKLAANCDNSTTVRTKMQQSVPKLSQIGR